MHTLQQQQQKERRNTQLGFPVPRPGKRLRS
jgi:hypothetical protein